MKPVEMRKKERAGRAKKRVVVTRKRSLKRGDSRERGKILGVSKLFLQTRKNGKQKVVIDRYVHLFMLHFLSHLFLQQPKKG